MSTPTRLPLTQPPPLAKRLGTRLPVVYAIEQERKAKPMSETLGWYRPDGGALYVSTERTTDKMTQRGVVVPAQLLGWADASQRERIGPIRGVVAIGGGHPLSAALQPALEQARPAPWEVVRAFAWAALREGDERYAVRGGVLIPWAVAEGVLTEVPPAPVHDQLGLLPPG